MKLVENHGYDSDTYEATLNHRDVYFLEDNWANLYRCFFIIGYNSICPIANGMPDWVSFNSESHKRVHIEQGASLDSIKISLSTATAYTLYRIILTV